jgi:Anti-sigma-K factor rskA
VTDSHFITCDECQSRLEEFALDELAVDVRTQVADHLADGCPACNQRLGQILDDLAQLAHSLPIEQPPPRIERELLNRIAANKMVGDRPNFSESTRKNGTVPLSDPAPTRKISPKSLTRGLIAAALALAATIMGIAAWNTWRDILKNPNGAGSPWAELQLRVDQANASQQFPSIPQLQFASLGSHSPEIPVTGYVVQDHLARQWHVYAFHLPALPAGRAYQLWFDTGNAQFVSAGAADVDPEGTLSRLIDVPSDLLAIKGLAISDEPTTGSDHPTGEKFFEAPLP